MQVNYLAAEMMAGELGVQPQSDLEAMQQRALMEVKAGGDSSTAAVSGQKRKFVPATTSTGGALAALEQQAAKIRATISTEEHGGLGSSGTNQKTSNPEELDIDGDGEEEEGGFALVQKPVPAAVFGSAASAVAR